MHMIRRPVFQVRVTDNSGYYIMQFWRHLTCPPHFRKSNMAAPMVTRRSVPKGPRPANNIMFMLATLSLDSTINKIQLFLMN